MSEEKIIARRNKLIEWTKTQDIRCTPFCETINENINSINYLLHELQKKENIINKAVEYHDNCINNLLDLNKIDNNEKLAYKVAYEIHNNYLNILKGENNE